MDKSKEKTIKEYMSEIGRRGGRQTLKKRGKRHFSAIAKMKGRKKKVINT